MKRGTSWNRRGQSMVEYALILAVVIAAIAIAAGTQIRPAVTSTLTSAGDAIENAAGELTAGLE